MHQVSSSWEHRFCPKKFIQTYHMRYNFKDIDARNKMAKKLHNLDASHKATNTLCGTVGYKSGHGGFYQKISLSLCLYLPSLPEERLELFAMI